MYLTIKFPVINLKNFRREGGAKGEVKTIPRVCRHNSRR